MDIKVHPITAEMREDRRLDFDLIFKDGELPLILPDWDAQLLNIIIFTLLLKNSIYWGEE